MLSDYQHIVGESVKYIQNHPKAGVLILSFAGSGILGKFLVYLWRRKCADSKRLARQEKAKARKKEVTDKLTEDVNSEKIIQKPVQELLAELRSGSLSVVEVLHAFQKEALRVSEDNNCVTEPIPEAEDWARALDDSQGFKGLLHGMPVSLKENVAIEGYDSTAGMEKFIGLDASEDSVIVKVLKLQGAVPYVRTNIPQTMLSYDCHNPLYGTTVNPQDKKRTPGGSSSGEGAIIGSGGSVMGIGNDVGGSLRVPAEFCGIYTLKPTWTRISQKGMFSPQKGNIAIKPTNGPMARDFDALLLLSKALFSPPMFELDPLLPNLPFDNKEYEKTTSLRIGFYTYDGMMQCQPSQVRAVLEAKKALEAMGHEVVHFDFPTIMGEGFPGVKYFAKTLTPDRFARLRKALIYDRPVASISLYTGLGNLPKWLTRILSFVVGFKDQMLGSILKASLGFEDMEDYLHHMADVEEFRSAFLKAWQSMDLDAVICPVFPCPPVTRDLIAKVSTAGCYCWLYNLLNYPSGVMPVTKVTQDDLDKAFDPKHFKPTMEYERWLLKSSEGSVGLSVGVQCVALPFREEVCLRVMRDLTQQFAQN